MAARKIESQIMTEFTWLKNEELPEGQIYVTPDEMESHLYRDCKYLAKSNYYLCIDESYIPPEEEIFSSGTGGYLTIIAYNKGGKGVHHIDVSLVDEAGNEWNIPRVKYIRVGNFRLYLAASLSLLCIGAIVFLLIRKGRRNRAQYK